MEKTYLHTIETLDGTEKEITLNRLTMRIGLKLVGLNETEAVELLVDTISPGTLDEIAPTSLTGLVEVIRDKEKSFFAQLAKSLETQKPSPKNRKKSK